MEIPIIEAARSKGRNVFDRSNTGIVSSNPTLGVNVFVFSVCMLSWEDRGRAMSRTPPSKEACLISERFFQELILNRGDRSEGLPNP
jgi:hypothetical protein